MKSNIVRSPLLSIPGYDKIIASSKAKVRKAFWISILLSCSAICIFQLISCFHEFYYGSPGIDVYFEESTASTFAALLFCPADFTGSNAFTNNLKEEYEKLFNVSKEKVYFSDLIRLPNIDMNHLWDMYGFTPNDDILEVWCAIVGDKNCYQPEKITLTSIRTTVGRCIYFAYENQLPSFGAATFVKIKIPKQPDIWIMPHLYYRILYIPKEENPIYIPTQDGIYLLPLFSIKVSLSFTKLINLNLPNNPCQHPVQVEKCVDKCIEDLIYFSMKCRLPYMNNSLPDCTTPKSFNESLTISRNVMSQKSACRRKCQRKCDELLLLPTADMSPETSSFYLEVFSYEIKTQIIKEYRWYTFSSLVMDGGGSLGTFLGICFLNFIEILEVIIYKIKIRRKPIKQIGLKQTRRIRAIPAAETHKRNKNNEKFKKSNHTIIIGIQNPSPSNKFPRNQELTVISEDTNRIKAKTIPTLKKSADPAVFKIQNLRGSNRQEDSFTISISGLDRILNNKMLPILRLFWMAVLLISLALCLCLIVQTIKHFINDLPDMNVEYERNDSVKFPSLTFCSVQPFQYSRKIRSLKEYYLLENNITNATLDEIPLAKLMELPEINVTEIWEFTKPQKLSEASVKYTKFMGATIYDDYDPLIQNYVQTVYGTCLSVHSPQLLTYEGMATNLFYLINLNVDTDTKIAYMAIIHDEVDDPLLLDPLLAIPMSRAAVITLSPTKVERLNHKNRHCASPSEVVLCNRRCFDQKLDEALTCRLPFMENSTKEWCKDSKAFQESLDNSQKLLKNFALENKCNCPLKTKEYFYKYYFGEYPVELPFSVSAQIMFFQSNIFTVFKDYYKVNGNAVFANICGTLGLFLGICIPSIFEMGEYCYFLFSKKQI